jgi:hypothetical protein
MSKVRQYLTESKGLAKYYTNVLDDIIGSFDEIISSMRVETPKYLEDKDLKDVEKKIKNIEKYIDTIIAEMNNITDLIAKGERK